MGWFGKLGSERPWAQGCVIAASGAVLGATSCFGMLMGYDVGRGTAVGSIFTTVVTGVFFLSLVAVPAGFVWFIVGLVLQASRRNAVPPAAAPPPLPPRDGNGAG